MTKAMIRGTALALALAAAPAAYALPFSDKPSGPEKAMLAEALLEQGYVQWDKVKLKDGLWEVDEARTIDGHKVDLKLDRDFNVVAVDD
ncbi:PepSY domain-containing protein [Terrihabitans sp. B22-R8]|uniref:PepSY domain-containing protein n=1 Tax=Terrihabitans sp. B22-R8 TaxID=3425128 RepID=UPI00403CE75A